MLDKLGFMANPAELLLGILSSWQAPTATAEGARNDRNLSQHRQAVKYLNQIEELLPVLQEMGIRTGVYERYLPKWSAIVFNYPSNWRGTHTGEINQVPLDQLESLVGYLDQVTTSADTSKFALLDLYLDAVLRALDQDDSLSPLVATQARGIVAHVRKCMKRIAIVGDFEFTKAIESLFAMLSSIEMKSRHKEKWEDWKEYFVWPFVYDTFKFAGGYGLALVGPQMLALMS